MKTYIWLFIILTLAQMVFALAWFLFIKKLDRVIIVSSIIYSGAIVISYVSFEVENYSRRKKELLANLP